MAGRGGAPHRGEPDRLIVVDQPLLAQGQHIRLGRQEMQGKYLEIAWWDSLGGGLSGG
jgi:hypothetical protein